VSAPYRALRIAPALIVLSCAPGPITWDTNASATAITQAPQTPASVPVFASQCTASVRTTGLAGTHYAAWWAVRSDSTADIVASSSTDGRTWTTPVKLDSADVARDGCRRVPPALAADGDNLQVVYTMKAREGPGVFLAHSMDRAHTFHSPVAVVYGEKLGLASVAARGNFVIVAYEDPNTTPTRISIAVSTTMAHLFEFREVVSPEDVAASRPEASTDGTHVTVSWQRAGDSTRIIRRGSVR